MNLGSTGIIKEIVSYLDDIKLRKDYNYIEMGKIFDKILNDWRDITIFVKKEDSPNEIKIKITQKMFEKRIIFIIFGKGYAANIAISAIVSMKLNNEFEGYLFFLQENLNRSYTWVFEKTGNEGIDLY